MTDYDGVRRGFASRPLVSELLELAELAEPIGLVEPAVLMRLLERMGLSERPLMFACYLACRSFQP